jgi:hypothetical protein
VAKKADTKAGGHKSFRTAEKSEEEPLFSSFAKAADLLPDFMLMSRVSIAGRLLFQEWRGIALSGVRTAPDVIRADAFTRPLRSFPAD